MEGRTFAVTKGRRVDVNRSIAKYGIIVLVIFYFERWLEFMVTLYFFFFLILD